MVLVDGDGLGTSAEEATVKSSEEMMSNPETLKSFINFCARYAPAEEYDLILWDHGGGPAFGFGMDEHEKLESIWGSRSLMSFSQIMDALSDNAVTKDGGTFDLIDFDACLMNSVELDLVLADYTNYYLASPEAEPGYGQYYTGWLDMLGDEATKQWPELAESIAWAASVGRLEDLVVAFAGDDLAQGTRAEGLYFKHRGNMAAARDFLRQSGAADLADGYATAVHRLSEGWLPLYAGNYHGRNHEAGQGHTKRVVRLEATLEPAVCDALTHDAGGLNAELARLGFPDAGDATTSLSIACAQLLALGLPATVQLDVHDDGSFAGAFGLTLFFTGTHNARMSLFRPGGAADEALRRLEALGVADGRWRHAVRGSFALPVPLALEDGARCVVGVICRPDCVKLKWAHGRLAPARFYQVVRVAPLGTAASTQ